MSTFLQTVNPTSFGFFDNDPEFQTEADKMVTFVKRSLGDDILSVELTKKQIWAEMELSVCEYSRLIHEFRTRNDLINVLGLPTGSTDLTNKNPKRTLNFTLNLADAYSTAAGIGGSYNLIEGVIDLKDGQQDYNLYTDVKIFSGSMSGSSVANALPSGSSGKLRVIEVMHFEPLAAQAFLLNSSNMNNFLATNFNYESFTGATSAFMMLPVFEDVLRRQTLETSFRVRRSQYSWKIVGSKLRIFPIPSVSLYQQRKLFINLLPANLNSLSTVSGDLNGIAFDDDSVNGISGPNNIPLSNLPFNTITDPGRQWIRLYTLALCKELLGLIRSKMDSIPVPNGEVRLNGPALVDQGREDKDKLIDQLKEFLAELTYDKILEREVSIAQNLQIQLRLIPVPNGGAITIG